MTLLRFPFSLHRSDREGCLGKFDRTISTLQSEQYSCHDNKRHFTHTHRMNISESASLE